jgi:hypothetical protein
MSKIYYKVLRLSDAYLFRQKKTFGPIYNYAIGSNNNLIEENIDQCKYKIYNNYKNQSVTVFLLKKNNIINDSTSVTLDYNNVVDSHDIIFDENNIFKYFNSVDNLDKKFQKKI